MRVAVTTAEERRAELKENLGYVRVNDSEPRLWGKFTDDFGSFLLPDLLREDIDRLTKNELGRPNLCVSVGSFGTGATVIVDELKPYGWAKRGVGGGVLCAMSGVALNRERFDALQVSAVKVTTSIVGMVPEVVASEGGEGSRAEFVDKMFDGEPVLIRCPKNIIEHEDWSCGTRLAASPQTGIGTDGCMTARIPVRGDTPLEAIETAIERAEAYMVLLSILNGGHQVDLVAVELDVGDSNRFPIPILFRRRVPDLAPLGFAENNPGVTLHRNRLKTYRGLKEIGMAGVKNWVEWMTSKANLHVVEQWLHAEDESNSMFVVEGLARSAFGARDNGSNHSTKVKAVLKNIGLPDLIGSDRRIARAIDAAHNHRKHIGQRRDGAYYEAEDVLAHLSVLMSYVVPYGCLVAAGVVDVNDEDSEVVSSWAGEIKRSYEGFVREPLVKFAETLGP